MKKMHIPSEAAYFLAIILLSLAVAMIASTNFGVSMIVAPAYIISEKIPLLSFGQSEYIVQGILFIIFCILMKKVRLVYFSSFLTGIIYGAVLDLWRIIIPHFNPEKVTPGEFALPARIIYFIFGVLLTSFSIALFFKTYFYPQVYDFFVKGVCKKYSLNTTKFKTGFDSCFLIIAIVLSLALFRRLVGIGIGTIIMTFINGTLIGAFSKLLDKYFIIEPHFRALASKFEL